MQDEINEKTIALYIKTGKLTAQTLQKAMKAILSKGKKQLAKPPQGKQSLKQLMKQNAGVSNIEITEGNIKAFYFCFDFHRIYDSSPMFHYYWGLCYWTNCIYCATLVLAQNYVNVLLNTRRPQRHNKQEI